MMSFMMASLKMENIMGKEFTKKLLNLTTTKKLITFTMDSGRKACTMVLVKKPCQMETDLLELMSTARDMDLEKKHLVPAKDCMELGLMV